MNLLFKFFKKFGFLVLFLLLEIITVNYYIKNADLGEQKIVNINGTINTYFSDIKDYFSLKQKNISLNSEIEKLHSEIKYLKNIIPNITDTLLQNHKYSYDVIRASITKNSTTERNNFLILNKGKKDSVEINMVATFNSVLVGFVINTSENFSVVQSILSNKVKTSGMLKKNNSICSVYWGGVSPKTLEFKELSKYSDIEIGDTIVTTNFSSIFPPGLIIGTVTKKDLINDSFYNGEILIAMNFNKLQYLTLIKNENPEEVLELENSIKNR